MILMFIISITFVRKSTCMCTLYKVVLLIYGKQNYLDIFSVSNNCYLSLTVECSNIADRMKPNII